MEPIQTLWQGSTKENAVSEDLDPDLIYSKNSHNIQIQQLFCKNESIKRQRKKLLYIKRQIYSLSEVVTLLCPK